MYREISRIDTSKYTLVNEYPEFRYEYNIKELAADRGFVYTRNQIAKFVYKKRTREPYIHIGEKVAYELAKKAGIKCCRVELYKLHVPERMGNKYDRGAISVFEQSSEDVLISGYWVVREQARKMGIENYFKSDIDLIFEGAKRRFEQKKRPIEEYNAFVEDFIDMTVFDLKFGNYDRKLENWILRHNTHTGVIDLYPMYDNEAILGFAFDEPEEYDLDTMNELINQQRSVVCRPEDRERNEAVNFDEMLEYLLSKYPAQTEKSLEKVLKITLEDLNDILDNIPDLPEERKRFARSMFVYRDVYVRKILKKYESEKESESIKKKKLTGVGEDTEAR